MENSWVGLGAALALLLICSVSQAPGKRFTAAAQRQIPPAHRRHLKALQLDPAVRLDPTPKPSSVQIAAFRNCIDDYISGRSSSSAGDDRVVTEAGQRSQLTVTFLQDSRFAPLKNLNAQKRGERMQPLAFAEPGSTADVAAVVKCSVIAGLRFTARNGGHHYEANSLLDGGVVIDLIKLQDLKINKQDNSVVIGAGQKLGSIYAALAQDGSTLPAGTCVGVGISGITLGGGVGHATRQLGPLADSVLQATVVLPDGRVVTASPSSEPDLFWAIRGGGPLYGIVTSWTFKLHRAPPKASIMKCKFQQNCTAAKFAEVLKAWNEWKPWELSGRHALVDIECGYGHLWVQIWYWGSLEELRKTAKASPVFNLEGAYDFHSKEYDWSDFIVRVKTNLHDSPAWSLRDLGLSSVAQDQGSFVAGSLLATAPMSTEAISAMSKLIGEAQQHAFIQARAWGGAMSSVSEDYNAFPWRKPLFEFQVYSGGGGTATDRNFVDRTLSTMQPLMNSYGELYNYFHCVADPWKTYFGPHAARLQQIKKKYDPENRMGGLYCQQGVVQA